MVVLHSAFHIATVRFSHPRRSSPNLCRRFLPLRSLRCSLPSPIEKAEYHSELEAAVDAVERACRLCVDVKRSLFASNDRILEKNDQSPVTVADFGVQALVSLELGKMFPSIPLVAEEDSAAIRSNNLADFVADAVTSKASSEHQSLTKDDILKAIDRGGKDAFSFGDQPATYWVLDPIDGTVDFCKEMGVYMCLCKYMLVASGKASVFILRTRDEKTIKAWDHAVGIICVHEAGGKVTDWEGSQIDFAADLSERRAIFPSGGVLVTNGNLHDTILQMISSGTSIV